MGLVTRDSILFNDAIKANISLGQQTLQMMIIDTKIANAYEFVKKDLLRHTYKHQETVEITFWRTS
jgi:ABC-type bacteriocin/lantibiotic exporter with double-glycine peptidase domain